MMAPKEKAFETEFGSTTPLGSDPNGMKEQLGSFAEEAKSHAAEALMPMKDKVREVAQGQKNILADRISGFAKAMDAAAADFASESPAAGDMMRSAAGAIKNVSQSIRDRNIEEATEMIGRFARNQPVTFFAGAVVAGVVLSRLLKSSSPAQR